MTKQTITVSSSMNALNKPIKWIRAEGVLGSTVTYTNIDEASRALGIESVIILNCIRTNTKVYGYSFKEVDHPFD